MYLFIFSILLSIFQYVNSKNILDKYEKDITKYKTKMQRQDERIEDLEALNFELNYFNIEGNDYALDYFLAQDYNTDDVISAVKEGLYDMNDYEGEAHPIIPYVSTTASKLLINKIRILNHRWLVANFTDGAFWGEIFVTYTIAENNRVNYKLESAFIYPNIP